MGACVSTNEMQTKSDTRDINHFMKEYKKPSDLQEFTQFFLPTTHSALSRNLTHDIWNEYRDLKCDQGVPFRLCVFSGIKNQDAGIGIYAGSHDSYIKFHRLFDRIIEDYHGYGPDGVHRSDMNPEVIERPAFSDDQQKLISSARIRVSRNFEGYPMCTGLDKKQRIEILNIVKKACESFEGDLEGTFYVFKGMSEAQKTKLNSDCFLFKQGDRMLQSAGLNDNWPEGRGVFHNTDKTLLIWVGEEDHIRIISMQRGHDIAAVFERLSKACEHIQTSSEKPFMHDQHLGYISCCPTNLGTGLRGSVHLTLPRLKNNKTMFKEIADKYMMQIRGIHGEHVEVKEGIFDISNKIKIGRSENELVQDLINCTVEMVKEEQAMPEIL